MQLKRLLHKQGERKKGQTQWMTTGDKNGKEFAEINRQNKERRFRGPQKNNNG
jgi:hypothetical protein